MSPRKKNTSKAGLSKQPTINNFFSSKSKHASTSARPKRLAQSSLAARPLRSKRSPDPEEILDLTHSTSPLRRSESPPSAKKRKVEATSPDQSPMRGAQRDRSPVASSRSISPASHLSQKPSAPSASNNVHSALVSPALSRTGNSQAMLDIDPDEIVESSQTQYLHLRFTPSSQRVVNMDPGSAPAPVFTSVSTRTRQQSHEPSSARKTPGPDEATEESQYTIFIPSSQGEISEPFTPRKRNWTSLDRSGTNAQTQSGAAPSNAQGSNTANRLVSTPKRQWPTSTMPPPAHPTLGNTPTNNHLIIPNPFTPHFSSPQPIPTPMYPSERSDQIPSSQGEPSIEATELGTMESPPKLAKYPSVATDLLPCVPSSVPASQDTPYTPQRATTPLLPISNLNINPPQTPHRVAPHNPPSSPTDFPSPGRLLSSLGFKGTGDTNNALVPDPGSTALPTTDEAERRTPAHAFSNLPHPDEDAQSHGEESPRRSQSSSQTVVPSSQPIHDSSPPPEYDLDPKRHSFNQSRLQSLNQPAIPAQSPAVFDSRHPSNSSRPYFTARTHHSPLPSSQSLPPSQSPIKGGQFDPNQSAAGVRGVFGMLGFGSEADNHEAQSEDANEEIGPHTPVTFDLPPSSPPPQTPTRYKTRESSPDSYLVPPSSRKGKAKARAGKTPIRDSPLARAFEAAKRRSKTATPSAVRRPASKINQVASSPIRLSHADDMDVDSSPVQNSQRPTPKTGKTRAELSAETPSLAGRSQRASQATRFKGSQSTRQNRSSMRAQRQKSVDYDIVESSDAEEMEMEVDIPPSPAFPASTRATAGIKSSAVPRKPISTTTPGRKRPSIHILEEMEDQEYAPATPVREERLPSSVSPSPIRIRDSPPPRSARHSSPPSENTQTQDEAETQWESLRPSQSVSQVYERQLIEEAERERRLRMESNAEKAKVLVGESPDMPKDGEVEEMGRVESQPREESLDQEPVRPVTISLNPCSPTNVPNEPPRLVLPHAFSTPTTQRTAEKAHYVVTPTKIVRRTPARTTPSRKSLTPSSMMEEDDPEEYTYVEETFNPTESQRSFLNRILLGNSTDIS
ncbi:unnamed protein product [Rhizoctonia solani]|uniref:Uncharacterized protein n=1 Tax=Rhizoctonia solani TaxID=456999 RepID=A0A8H3DPT0_9AGAM|nr:unnamed protein product [Rhizoctonia solani]